MKKSFLSFISIAVVMTTVCISLSCKSDTTWVEGIALNESAVTLTKQGATVQLELRFNPSDASNQNVTWSSDKPGVATVSDNGLVTAVGEGIAIISVVTDDGNLRKACKVTVDYTVYLNSLSLEENEVVITKLGETAKLSVSFDPNNVGNKLVFWTTSNKKIATVDENGLVTAINPGTATITATSDDKGEYAVTCTVHVRPAVETMTISSNVIIVVLNDAINLSVTITPGFAYNTAVVWSSNDPSIAEIDQNGKVTGKKVGKTTVKVVSEDNEELVQTCDVEVVVASGTLYEVTFENGVPDGMREIRNWYNQGSTAYEGSELQTAEVEGIPALWLNFLWLNNGARYQSEYDFTIPSVAYPYLKISSKMEVDVWISAYDLEEGGGAALNYGQWRFEVIGITYSGASGSGSFGYFALKPLENGEGLQSVAGNATKVGDYYKYTWVIGGPYPSDFPVANCTNLNMRIGHWGVYATKPVYITSIRYIR